MSKRKKPLVHLLIPKEHRVWCRPRFPVGDLSVTTLPSKATCAVCLGTWRVRNTGKGFYFRVAHTMRDEDR
jgi:hypothetical protein